MDKDSWLDDIEQLSFYSELKKLADSPIYPEERNEEEPRYDDDPEDFEEEGYVYHSNDGIAMHNNVDAKHKIDALKKKAYKNKKKKL
jgi:hypothetical protein